MTLNYIVKLMRCSGSRDASVPCSSDAEVLEVVKDWLDGTLDVEHYIKIERTEQADDGLSEVRQERDRLLAVLDACGGRNIDVAEQIDELNRELGESEDEEEN